MEKSFYNNGRFCILLISHCVLLMSSGLCSNPFSYDRYSEKECVTEPPKSSSNIGGLILNRDVEDDAGNRKLHGNGAISEIVHRVHVHQGHIYTFSAWVRTGKGESTRVEASFRTEDGGLIHGGEVAAGKACWSLLKGGIVANFSGPVDLLFKSQNRGAEISVAEMSLQRFTKRQWKLEQDQVIDKIRKSRVRFQVTYRNKTAVKGATISVNRIKPSFLLGCGMNYRILSSQGYRNWFASRFKLTSFTNEMKWYTTEKVRGRENYTLADSMLKFAEENGIKVRGHTVLWDNPKMQPSWVQNVTGAEDLMNVTLNRINSVMTRYKGKLTGWDVMNENVHFRFFEDMLGENASASFYSLASKLDPDITLFVNEYNTLENSKEGIASPVNVKKKMEEIVAFPGNMNMRGGIGAQGHFGPYQPNLAYIRSALDTLGSLGFPVWLTEVDIPKCPDQVKYLEEILREAYSHPAVEGIIMFAGPEVSGFDKLTLADKDFKNTETGDLVDRLLKEWQPSETQEFEITSDGGLGFSQEVSLLHGDYRATVNHHHPPWMKSLSTSLSFEVKKEEMVQVVIDA